ncbi:hypothetical protein QAD02_020385 [Eretmocerus hayati]|uniref:Uncharacterized protein n=1 Tax=Eretmocerus hayati TaxID=131215 RepID=A0ACC2PMC3_9HYME|nr:hypothetical protein QAD02_020385 [Eretmocerus hayati]
MFSKPQLPEHQAPAGAEHQNILKYIKEHTMEMAIDRGKDLLYRDRDAGLLMFRNVGKPLSKEEYEARLRLRTKDPRKFNTPQTLSRTSKSGVFINHKDGEKFQPDQETLLKRMHIPELPSQKDLRSLEKVAKLAEEIIEAIADEKIKPVYATGLPPRPNDETFEGLPHKIAYNDEGELKSKETLGVLHPSCYVAGRYSFTEFHPEDGYSDSINYVMWGLGAAKIWIVIAPEDFARSQRLMAEVCMELKEDERFSGWAKNCGTPINHKCLMVTPSFLRDHNIRFEVAVQWPGDVAIVTHHSIHAVLNINDHLELHGLFHKLLKPESCSICGKCFDGPISLDKHILLEHTAREVVQKCPKCERTFVHLDRHLPLCQRRCLVCGKICPPLGFSSHVSFCLDELAWKQYTAELTPVVPILPNVEKKTRKRPRSIKKSKPAPVPSIFDSMLVSSPAPVLSPALGPGNFTRSQFANTTSQQPSATVTPGANDSLNSASVPSIPFKKRVSSMNLNQIMTPARSDSFDYAQVKLDASTVSSFGASSQNASRRALPQGHRGGSRVTRSLANTEASIELPEAASRPADVIAPPADFVPPTSNSSFSRHVSATDTIEAAAVNTTASAGNSSSLHARPATIPIDSAISPEIIVEPLALPGPFSLSEHVEGPFCLCGCQDSFDPSLETYATGLSVSLPSNAPSPVESRPISPAPPSYEEVVATSNPQSSNELAVPQPGNSRILITIVSFYRLRNAADEFSRVLSEVLGAERNSENLPDIVDISFGLHGVRHAEGAIDLPDLLSTLSRMSHSLSAIRDVAIAPESVGSTSGSSVEILSNPSDSNSPDSNAPTADFSASAPEDIDPPSPPDHDEAGPPDVVDESEGAMQNGAAQIIESPAEQNPLVPPSRDDDPAVAILSVPRDLPIRRFRNILSEPIV